MVYHQEKLKCGNCQSFYDPGQLFSGTVIYQQFVEVDSDDGFESGVGIRTTVINLCGECLYDDDTANYFKNNNFVTGGDPDPNFGKPIIPTDF